MPWHERPMKDAVGVRYASGRSQTSFDPKISEWGNPAIEEIVIQHLSSQRETSPPDPLKF